MLNRPPKALFVMEDRLNSRVQPGGRGHPFVNTFEAGEAFSGDALRCPDRIVRLGEANEVRPQSLSDVTQRKYLGRVVQAEVVHSSFLSYGVGKRPLDSWAGSARNAAPGSVIA